jgi:hypothetical protein
MMSDNHSEGSATRLKAKEKEWRAEGYDFRTFLGELVAAVTQNEVSAAMSL